jgi:ABC-type polysaccharide/polyol phosphate export permease
MLLGFSTPTPRSVPLSPLRDALALPTVIVRHRELLGAFVRRELRARIEGSALGRVWPVAQPALTFLTFYAIFGLVLGMQYSEDMAPHPPAGPGWRATFYLITGILPWTVLADSLGRGTGVVLENANLIKKIAFPSELLPLYQVVVYHVYFLIGFVILLGLELLVNGTLPGALAWFPAILLVQMMFIAALTLLFSAANVFVRDVMQVVPIVLTFWMFTTPVFYDINALGARAEAMGATQVEGAGSDAVKHFMADYMWLNPMATLLDFYRSIFSYGRMEFPVERLGGLFAVSAVLLYFCYAFFLRCKGRFADEV